MKKNSGREGGVTDSQYNVNPHLKSINKERVDLAQKVIPNLIYLFYRLHFTASFHSLYLDLALKKSKPYKRQCIFISKAFARSLCSLRARLWYSGNCLVESS